MARLRMAAQVYELDAYARLLCAITQQAIQDTHDCNGYSHGVDALRYLNDEIVQDLHEVIGINIRRKWTFASARTVRVERWT